MVFLSLPGGDLQSHGGHEASQTPPNGDHRRTPKIASVAHPTPLTTTYLQSPTCHRPCRRPVLPSSFPASASSSSSSSS
eukprot:7367615-Pyramimonas_sp.AAC.1